MSDLLQKYKFPIIETQVFPNIQYFTLILKHKGLTLEANENYQKRSFRNRYHIGSQKGILNLSIPLSKGKNEQQSIREVIISFDHNWQSQHWNSICSSYGKSPYFIYYKDEIKELLFSTEGSLFQYNQNIILEICKLLKIPIAIEHTTDFEKNIQASHYNKLKLNSLVQTIPYYQVYAKKSQFLNNLSILDLLFHMGPESILYLRKMLEQTD
jgi:hypothetical protein